MLASSSAALRAILVCLVLSRSRAANAHTPRTAHSRPLPPPVAAPQPLAQEFLQPAPAPLPPDTALPPFASSLPPLASSLPPLTDSLQPLAAAPENGPTLAPAPQLGQSLAPSPGLNGLPGENVTLLTYNTTCTGHGPGTRISGSGSWNGTGLFVGDGTFDSVPGPGKHVFTLANATFAGNASEGCIGAGEFSATESASSVGGDGTAVGSGTFHFPQGLVVGAGRFEGKELYFTNGTANMTTEEGSLYGKGVASGPSIICTGSGRMQGQGSFKGTGAFVGEGYFYATKPDEQATFLGSGLVTGGGGCASGEVYVLAPGETGGPEVAELVDFGDEIFAATLAAQEEALRPYARAPGPGGVARGSGAPTASRGPTQHRPRTPVSTSG